MSSTSFLGFASPNLLLLSELVTFKEPVTYFFRQIWDFLCVFHLFIYVPYFGFACGHGNSFLCVEEYEREGTGQSSEHCFNVASSAAT